MATKTLYWIRHGNAEHNELFKKIGEKAYYTIEDSKLTLNGIKQANELTKEVKNLDIKLIFCSPLTRCLDTCTLVFQKLNISVIVLDELLEYPQGSHICNKRKSKSILQHKYPKYTFNLNEYPDWNNKRESIENLNKRILNFYNILKTRPETKIAIVAHNSLMCEALKLEEVKEEIAHCKIILQII